MLTYDLYWSFRSPFSYLVTRRLRMLEDGSTQTLEAVRLLRQDVGVVVRELSGIYLLRSVEPLPRALEADFGQAYLYVHFLNGREIEPVGKDTWIKQQKRRYSLPGFCGYFIQNHHLCVVNYDDVDELYVNVDGHFEAPEVVSRHNLGVRGSCKSECIPTYELPFDCPGHILRRTIEMVRPVVLRRLGLPLDTSNNTKNDTHVTSQT